MVRNVSKRPLAVAMYASVFGRFSKSTLVNAKLSHVLFRIAWPYEKECAS
jgi:hypothetical protein